MAGVSAYMVNHHKECDSAFASIEEAVGASDWNRAQSEFDAFLSEMNRHFDLEENLLFPAFAQKTGMSGGPTQVMRMEHEQMRGMLDEMRVAAEAKEAEQFLGASETLLILMQQHNFKEEAVLYSMMDEVLGEDADRLLDQLESSAG